MPRYASRLSPVLGLLLWSLGSAANAQHSPLFGDTLEFRAIEIAPWAPR
jgi:hypothetical protein